MSRTLWVRRAVTTAAAGALALTTVLIIHHQNNKETPFDEAAARLTVQNYLVERASHLTGAAAPVPGAVADGLKARIGADSARIREERDRFRKTRAVEFTEARVEAAVDQFRHDGEHAVSVFVRETTVLRYHHHESMEPREQRYEMDHVFGFVDEGGTWLLASATPMPDEGPPPPTYPELRPAPPTSAADPATSSTTPATAPQAQTSEPPHEDEGYDEPIDGED